MSDLAKRIASLSNEQRALLFQRLKVMSGTISTVQADVGLVTGPVPLTPIQHKILERNQLDLHLMNIVRFLEVFPALDPALVKSTVQHLLEHHDALRLRFELREFGWHQYIANPNGTIPVTSIDLSMLPATQQERAIEANAAELQTSLNLSEGPVWHVVLFNLGLQQPGRLLIIIHHLVADAFSVQILIEDFLTVYQQLSRGQTITLPSKTTSFKRLAELLEKYAQSLEIQKELDYWLKLPWERINLLPVDYREDIGARTEKSFRIIPTLLSAQETHTLLQTGGNTRIIEILLTSLAQAFVRWTGSSTLLVEVTGHGRKTMFEDVDLSRTIGWFADEHPVVLDLEAAHTTVDALTAIKDQLCRVPNDGLGYGLLYYLNEHAEFVEKMRALPRPEVFFNYLGHYPRRQNSREVVSFRPARESTGPRLNLDNTICHLLKCEGGIFGDQLHLNWWYSDRVHTYVTVNRLAQSFIEVLRSLIAHCSIAVNSQ